MIEVSLKTGVWIYGAKDLRKSYVKFLDGYEQLDNLLCNHVIQL